MDIEKGRNFDKVKAFIKDQYKEVLLQERGEEFQAEVYDKCKAEFDRMGDILKHKLEVQTNEKFALHPVQYPKDFESWVGYNTSYVKTHPWKIVQKAFSEIKWAWQRVFRGWDDRVIWSIDYYLAENIPVWLETLKTKKQGIPISMYDEADFDKNFNPSKAGDIKATKKYNDILDKIKQSFLDYPGMREGSTAPEIYQPKYEKFVEGFNLFRDFFDTFCD